MKQCVALLLSFLLAIIPVVSCSSSPTRSSNQKADIVLTGTNSEVTKQLVGQYDVIAALAQKPGSSTSILVGTDDNNNPVIVYLSFDATGKPILTKPDGAQAALEFGLDGIKPVIRLTDINTGKIITQCIIESETIRAKLARGQSLNPADWVQAGIVAIGVAIIAWLGLKAIELTVVGIGYLAMVAIIAGAAVVAGGVISSVFRTLGWSVDDFINLFRQSFADLADLIAGAIQKFQETYNLG